MKVDLHETCLKKMLEDEIFSLKFQNNEEFLNTINEIYNTLKLLEKESDPFLVSLAPGYIREFVTAFLILYFGTHDLEKSLEAFHLIKSLTRYIVLLDKAYDTKNMKYKELAEKLFKSIMKEAKGHLNHSINHTMSILWTVAEYEIKLKERMLDQEDVVFEKNDLCYHILQKSSDTIVYASVLDNYIKNFNPNILQLYHYNQVLLDIQDDFKDIDEDLKNKDLNLFVMASLKTISISDILSGNVSVNDIKIESSKMILSIIDFFETCIDELSISAEFSFMKKLSSNYIQTLRESINKI